MSVVVRFAPSPTGYLHIGSARTALFNYLFAKHHGGQFLLRIEDTDRARSTEESVGVIFDSLHWLGLEWDAEPVFQFTRASRHQEIAHDMVKRGKAYYCYTTTEELDQNRVDSIEKGRSPRYDGRWRDLDPSTAPAGVKPVIRLKMPKDGSTTILDLVQGSITVDNKELDDMVLLRADGTPTYMLSVVVDDYDMGITHVIRGDDHLTNAFRQYHLYQAMEWSVPKFAHIPLIHGSDGSKLSKRHGALGVEAYRTMGYLPQAMNNHLLRLGWSHGNDEIIPMDQAIEWFDLDSIGRSAARFDLTKLTNLNAHYIRNDNNNRLLKLLLPFAATHLGRELTPHERDLALAMMDELKERAKTLDSLAENALIVVRPHPLDEQTKAQITPEILDTLEQVRGVFAVLIEITPHRFSKDELEALLRGFCQDNAMKLVQVAQPLRIALTGKTISPSIFHLMEILGPQNTMERINQLLEQFRVY